MTINKQIIMAGVEEVEGDTVQTLHLPSQESIIDLQQVEIKGEGTEEVGGKHLELSRDLKHREQRMERG